MFKLFKETKKEPEDLKEIISQFKDLEKNFKKISEELEKLKEKNKFNVQKIGMVRFNPFKEIGSNQSFSVVLLDGNDDGIVITSLYGREENRIYGKPIKGGISEYLLSDEEKEAITSARLGISGVKPAITSARLGISGVKPAINKAKYGEKNQKFNSKTAGSGGFGTH